MTNYVNFKLSKDVEKNPGPTHTTLIIMNVTSSNVFSGRYNAVIPHKTSQQAHARLVTTLDFRHSCINTASA